MFTGQRRSTCFKMAATTALKKRKLADMDAEEFMMYGLDCDLSEDENDCRKKTAKGTFSEKKSSKTAAHKNQLSSLQKKDPEFFKFLQDNDQELLKFNDSDTDQEIEEESDDEEEDVNSTDNEEEKGEEEVEQTNKSQPSKISKKKGDKPTEKSKKDEEVSGDNIDNGDVLSKKKGKLVTMEMIKQWKKELEKLSLHALRQSMKAFRSAVHGALDDIIPEKKSQKHLAFRVEGNTVFNAIMQLCLKHVYPVLLQHVGGDSANKHGKMSLPSNNKKWSQVKTPLKFYLGDLLQLLRTLAEPSMLCVMLKHTQQLSSYYACYPKLTKMLIKRMVRMWGTGDEHVRVMAFLGISKLVTLLPASHLELCIKQLYMSFVKNSKFTSPKSKPLITFMQNSLVEVFRVDPQLTYQHAFMYIRQLAIHLRNAIVNNKKDSYQLVYNWQYIHCLHLWCRVLSEVSCQGVLDPLVYPLVQVTLGAIKLVPTGRYYPLRFHCVRSLNLLSNAKNTFVPTSPFLLEILDSPEFNKKFKMSTAKPTDFSCILKVSKSQLSTKPFEDAVMDNVFELLLEFFSTHAHSIAFPEISLPTVIRLRKFIKTTKVPKYRKQMKQLLDKIEETSKEVTDRRSSVSFSPKDTQEVECWTLQYKQHPNTIVKFYSTWKAMKPVVTHQHHQDDDADMEFEDSDSEEPAKPKGRKLNAPERTTSKKQKGKQKPVTQQENGEEKKHELEDMEDMQDIVEDFRFSSDEED